MLITNKFIVVLALSFLLLIETQAEAKKALLIGIEEYPHVPQLRGPVQDVEHMEQFIISHLGYRKEDIRKLINSRATRKNILHELKNWLAGSRDKDLLFYYSGHGWQQKDMNGDEKEKNAKDETIAPYDSKPKMPERIVENMILDDEIAAVVNRLRDRKLMFIFDSCHSGTVSRGIQPQRQDGEHRIKSTKSLDPFSFTPQRTRGLSVIERKEGTFIEGSEHVIVWSAASSSQQAFTDIETKSGSVFTNIFIKGIQERKADYNNDGTITNSEQLTYLRQESEAFCKRNRKACKLGLTPMLEIAKNLYGRSLTPEKKSQGSIQEDLESILPGGNFAEVTVKVRGGRHLRLGDTVTIECGSNRSGYLILLDINADGEMLQIYPNRYSNSSADNYIRAGASVIIPGDNWGFSIEAQPPIGKNTLIAILTEDRVEMNDLLGSHKDLQVIAEPAAYLADVASRLQSVWVGDEVNRAVKWSKAVFEYYIVR